MAMAVLATIILTVAACTANDGDDDTDAPMPDVGAACLEGAQDCNDTPGTGQPAVLPPNQGDEPVGSAGFGEDGVPVADAARYEGAGPVVLSGYFVAEGSSARLCSALAESFPPQCGGSSIVIANPDAISGVALIEEGQTQWSDGFIMVAGEVSDGVFTISVE